jgi:ubiquinone biosynthesis protein
VDELPRPRRVMVATDRSQTAERAVHWAAQFADRFDAELHVVQVIVGEPATNGSDRVRAATDDLLHHAQSLVGPRARGTVIVDRDPAMAIVRTAEHEAVDVLVVGNAGMAGRKEFLLGNVPNRISHNARCTVIIVNTLGANGNGAAPHIGVHAGPAEPPRPHRISRGSEIAAVFAKHGLPELFYANETEDSSTTRKRQARRLRSALEELGPTFAKIGQLLSTRPDLLPPEFVDELSQLQDRVTPLTEAQVVRVMEEDLGVPWEDVFETIEREPLAAGSIAQVHRASLAGGDKVVVKIQRPDANDLITQDLAVLKLFVETVGSRPGVRRWIDVPAVFNHVSAALQRELDFRIEARNAERMRAVLADFSRLGVPHVYADLSTSRLLVMRDVDGVPPAHAPAGPLRTDLAKQVVESFCKQILVDGFFHADPHPGNLMWQTAEQRLYFLDLGSCDEVDSGLREVMVLILTAFWQGDAAFLSDAILMLSDTSRSEPDVEAFRRDVAGLMAKHVKGSGKQIELHSLLQDVVELSFRHGVPLPESLTLTAKALAQMQTVAAQLDPHLDPFDVAGKFLMRWVARRVIAGSDPKVLLYESQKLKVRIVRVFEALERLVGARPGHKTDFSFRAVALEETLGRASRRLALGMTAGFALLASAMTAVSDRVAVWASPLFGIVGAVFLVALVTDLVRSGARHTRPHEDGFSDSQR